MAKIHPVFLPCVPYTATVSPCSCPRSTVQLPVILSKCTTNEKPRFSVASWCSWTTACYCTTHCAVGLKLNLICILQRHLLSCSGDLCCTYQVKLSRYNNFTHNSAMYDLHFQPILLTTLSLLHTLTLMFTKLEEFCVNVEADLQQSNQEPLNSTQKAS